ncbi:hypothetical protein PIB30_102329, partial [Stylosanthes scabra]|nr:hypothetical protein [Stylosanthes scabra]
TLTLQHECNAVSTHLHHQASHKLTLHPRLNTTTTSPHVPYLPRFTPHPQPTTHAYAYNPTHMRGNHTLTPCICVQLIHLSQPIHLAQPPLLLPSLTPPRICVASYAYAWLHPDHSTTIPTHMRYFQRICVANSPSTPFNPVLYAYAWNSHPKLNFTLPTHA